MVATSGFTQALCDICFGVQVCMQPRRKPRGQNRQDLKGRAAVQPGGPNPGFGSKKANTRAGHHAPPRAAETPVWVRCTGSSPCRQLKGGPLDPTFPPQPPVHQSPPSFSEGKKYFKEHIFIPTNSTGCGSSKAWIYLPPQV